MDVNNDGFLDVVGGSYSGEMVVYTGSKDGFNAVQILKEKPYQVRSSDVIYKGYSKGGSYTRNNSKISYFKYTNPKFGDYNGDGIDDIFIGGEAGISMMLNEGTKESPLFGERKLLLELDGTPIQVAEKDKRFYEALEAVKRRNGAPVDAIDYKADVTFYDWDNDGVGDLLIGSSYEKHGTSVITFHKGVKTENGIRFRRRVPLFEAMDGKKAFPGTRVALTVTDVNNDGKDDLLIGITILTLLDSGEHAMDHELKFKNKRSGSNEKMKYKGYAVVMYGGKQYK